MDREILVDQIDFAQARIEEIERLVLNVNPDQKGYKELADSYNKWIDRLDNLTDKLEHIDDIDIEAEKIQLEQRRLDIEERKIETQKTLEARKIDNEKVKIQVQEELENDKLNLEREKFAADQMNIAKEHKHAMWKEPVDIGLKVLDLGVKVAVPIIGITGAAALAVLSYENNQELKLCDGRIFTGARDVLKLATGKIV